jgi:hypothetical protein
MNKIFRFLENYNTFDPTKWKKFIIFIISPYILLLEYLCYRYFWNKIIITELVTKDPIIEYLNKSEFGFNWLRTKIYKKSILDPSLSFYLTKTNPEIKEYIRAEYVNKLSTLIRTNSNFNIEEYITIVVKVDDKISNINNQIFSNKIFEVDLQFIRLWYINKLIKQIIAWILLVGSIITITCLIF